MSVCTKNHICNTYKSHLIQQPTIYLIIKSEREMTKKKNEQRQPYTQPHNTHAKRSYSNCSLLSHKKQSQSVYFMLISRSWLKHNIVDIQLSIECEQRTTYYGSYAISQTQSIQFPFGLRAAAI